MIKGKFREELHPDFSFYFEGDCFTEAAGDFTYTVYCLNYDRMGINSGINTQSFEDMQKEYNGFLYDYEDGGKVAEVFKDYGIKDTKENRDKIKTLYDGDTTEKIKAFLEMKTGAIWEALSVHGYCQGDFTEVIYCKDKYSRETAQIIGEIYLGCAKEFSFTSLDEDGAENYAVHGYYIADSEAVKPEEYKIKLASYEGLKPDEIRLELIEDIHTITTADYVAY